MSDHYAPRVHLPSDRPQAVSPAHSMAQEILAEFDAFVDAIGDEYEAAITTEGPGILRVRSISTRGSFLLVLHGTTEDGTEAKLIQHVGQVSLFLVPVKRADPNAPRTPIGFSSL